MTIGDRISKRRKEMGLTQDELAKKMGYKSKAAISKIETNVNDITQSTVVKFAEALDTTVAYLMGWEKQEASPAVTKSAVLSLSHEESRLVKLYRRADEIDKRTVMTVLSRYEAAEDPAPPIRYIRHYLVPAAAGYASPIEGEEYENVPMPPDAPQEADFCIEIQGDSMEPFIQDGQRVYVKQGAPLQEFDPGIFFVDGDVFCKQWCPGYAGETYLLSANPKREDANITIFRDSGRSCVYFGKVLLDKKLPRPNYK